MLLEDEVIFKKISNITPQEKALVKAFSCGKDHIDSYLKNEALEEIKYGISKTFLMFIKQKNSPLFLLGFFSLTTDRVQIIRTSKLTNALKIWGNPIMPQSIPAIRIHYFAIHKDKQRKKLGSEMMFYTFQYIKNFILPHIGACLITLQSEKDVVKFYEEIGFCKTGQTRDKNISMAVLTNEFFIE